MKAYGHDRVNTYTTGTQESPAIARLTGGGYVVTWMSYDQDAGDDSWGIFAQRFSASGIAIGPEFRVNATQAGHQVDPTVAGLSTGDFVVVWADSAADGSGHGIYDQRYNASGVAQGSEFRVNATTSDEQSQPVVAAYTGGFVVVWTSHNQDGASYGV